MPIYQYHCTSCGKDLEIFQRMTDPSATTCPDCQGALRKVFSAVGIVFKGSGFYATDSKKGSSSTSSVASPPASADSSAKSTTDSASPAKTSSDSTTPATTSPASSASSPATSTTASST